MSAGRSALGGRAGAAAGTRPHSAAAPRLTCSGRAEEDGPAPPPPAPPCPRTQAFSAVYGEAMGRLPGAAATAPLGCLRRGGRSLNHTLGGRGGGGGEPQQRTNLRGEKLETRNLPCPGTRGKTETPCSRPGSSLPPLLAARPPPRTRLPLQWRLHARPVRGLGSAPAAGCQRPAGAGPLLWAGIFLSPSKASRRQLRARSFPIPATRAQGEIPTGGESRERSPGAGAAVSPRGGIQRPQANSSARGSKLGRPAPVVERAGDLSRVCALKFPCSCPPHP